MKNKKLNQWLWKWHFLSGIIALPFILILSATGMVYLFKEPVEKNQFQHIKEVGISGTPISYQKQWEIAQGYSAHTLTSMEVPQKADQATAFVSGKFGTTNNIYVNPYKGTVSGEITSSKTDMYKVRKLHGELLMGGFGTKIIELVGCWMVVLIITGIYIWWPERSWKLKSYFIPRTRSGRRTFFRDAHAISGFWLSALLLLILAGGLPWTDVFGSGFKWVQEKTQTGYPSTWNHYELTDHPSDAAMLPLDKIVENAKELQLPGKIRIDFPNGKNGVFSVQNTFYKDLSQQEKYHFNPYNAEVVKKHSWSDVGVLMRGRMWVMAFHQGQFGLWNWILILLTAGLLFFMSLSAVISYALRKRKNSWGVPKVPKHYSVSLGLIVIIGFLGVLLPLFGLSIIIISIFELLKKSRKTVTLK